jgi:ribonuclease HI
MVFRQMFDVSKMDHVVTDCGARRNPGKAGWGAIIRQNKPFTMVWKHLPKAMNETMVLRAVAEALCFLPPGMIV